MHQSMATRQERCCDAVEGEEAYSQGIWVRSLLFTSFVVLGESLNSMSFQFSYLFKKNRAKKEKKYKDVVLALRCKQNLVHCRSSISSWRVLKSNAVRTSVMDHWHTWCPYSNRIVSPVWNGSLVSSFLSRSPSVYPWALINTWVIWVFSNSVIVILSHVDMIVKKSSVIILPFSFLGRNPDITGKLRRDRKASELPGQLHDSCAL